MVSGSLASDLASWKSRQMSCVGYTGGTNTMSTTLPPAENEDNDTESNLYFYHPDHLGSASFITDNNAEAVQYLLYMPFGEQFVSQTAGDFDSRYKFSGKELDNETNYNYFGARYYDSDLSNWLSVDPMSDKYPNLSPYNYCANNPVMIFDPDGKDIVFIIDKEAANNYGHTAILVGSEKSGWRYVSINGTGEGARAWGGSKNPDLGTLIVDSKGNVIKDIKEAVLRANNINPNEEHSYDSFVRIKSTANEDKNAIMKAAKVATAKEYGIAGPGKSCIDVSQAAFESLVKDRKLDDNGDVPGQSDLIPNIWYNKIVDRVNEANKNINKNDNNKIEFVISKKNENQPKVDQNNN
jgi:RHS repeat-associated protein